MSEQAMIGEGDTVAEIASPFSEGVVVERVGTASVCVKFPRNGPGAAEVLRLDSVRLVRKAVAFPRYARVSLLGHRDLGLCRVTQERVGEATMLRCESVDAVTWTTPASVYALVEEQDGEEHLRVLRELRARNVQRKADEADMQRRQRFEALVTLIVDTEHNRVGVRVEPPHLLLLDHAMREAIDAAGGSYHGGHDLDDDSGNTVGFVADILTPDAAETMLRAMGFATFTRREPAKADELDMDIPF